MDGSGIVWFHNKFKTVHSHWYVLIWVHSFWGFSVTFTMTYHKLMKLYRLYKTPAASFNRGGSINIFVKHVERCLYNTMYISHFYTPSDTFNVFNSNTYCTVRPLFNVIELAVKLAISFNPNPPCYFQRTRLTPFNGSLNILIPPHSCSVLFNSVQPAVKQTYQTIQTCSIRSTVLNWPLHLFLPTLSAIRFRSTGSNRPLNR